MTKAEKIIQDLSDVSLLESVRALTATEIPADAPIRDLCSKVYNVPIESTTLLQIIGLAPLLAKEVAYRYELVCKEEGLM